MIDPVIRSVLDEYDDETEAALDAAAEMARDVAREAYRLRVREAAREKVVAERTEAAPAFDAGTLAEVLARPPEPAHRVEGLIPTSATTLIVAQRKTGKTTLTLNLARSLVEGGEFLGRFPTKPAAGAVAILNYEVSGAMLAGWASDARVPHDRLVLVNLRGRRNPLRHTDDRAALVDLLRSHQVETLVVDPFGRAYSGNSQNDAAEVGAWLVDLDTFARAEAGVSDLILTAHAGWDGERTRGSSALEDWPDVVVTMTRDKDDPSTRYLAAEGRDVLVDEDRLDFDPERRTLVLAGAGSRRQAKARRRESDLTAAVVELITEHPGLKTGELETRLRGAGHGFQRGQVGAAARRAVAANIIRTEHGPRNSTLHFPRMPDGPDFGHGSGQVLPSAPDYSRGEDGSSPQSSLYGGTTPATTETSSAPGPAVTTASERSA